jgi:hypothetical protein
MVLTQRSIISQPNKVSIHSLSSLVPVLFALSKNNTRSYYSSDCCSGFSRVCQDCTIFFLFRLYLLWATSFGLGCPRFPCLRVVNCEFANHPSIFRRQQSTNAKIAKSDVLCPRCVTQICGFADVNKNKHSPHCAAHGREGLSIIRGERGSRPPREKPTRGFVPSLQLASFSRFCESVCDCDFANLWIVGTKKKLTNSQIHNLQKRTSGTPYYWHLWLSLISPCHFSV